MIRFIYQKQNQWTKGQALWSILIFLIVNIVFCYIVFKCSFQQLAPPPPWYVSFVFLILILMDNLYAPYIQKKASKRFIADMIVWILLVISASYLDVVSYLGLGIVIKMYDVIYLKQLLFDIVRRKQKIYNTYVIVKIVYWILIYGHLTGCIFYALQMYLLQNQVFGPYIENTELYYQGQLLAYTPILMFQNLNRYVYAMYYSFALISTIAFGDIIGKNYIQDIYVMILIILSTIMISLIVQQMYNVFRHSKNKYLDLLNDVRYLSQRLKNYQQIPRQFRLQIINYLIAVNWRYINQLPPELQHSPQFKAKLIRSSIAAQPHLPVFFQKYILHKLTLVHYPAGIQLQANLPHRKTFNCYLAVSGKFWIGHSILSGKIVGGYQVQQQGSNFGIQQCVVGTNSIYPWLQLRTVTNVSVLVLSAQDISLAMRQLIQIDHPYDQPIQHLQMARDQAIFDRNKYKCSICNQFNHTLLNCQRCHFIMQKSTLYSIVNRWNYRGIYKRRNIKSKKINVNTSSIKYLPHCTQYKRTSQKLCQIKRYRQIFKNIVTNSVYSSNATTYIFQKIHQWPIYCSTPYLFLQQFQSRTQLPTEI